MNHDRNRRSFLRTCAAVFAASAIPGRALRAAANRPIHGPHPVPRPGISGAKVLAAADLPGRPQLIELFDAVRAAPEIIDGIRCHCGCAADAAYYSLLTCYEAPGMASACIICQGQGRLATRLHREGKTLDEIRAAIDAKFE